MDELTARAVLVPAPDVEGGLTTSIPRSQIEEALAQDETPIELILDVTRFSDGESIETRNVAITWEPNELKELLRQAEGDDVILTFDREALQEAVDADVEAHGIREKALVLAVAATAAAGGAAVASAEPGAYLGTGAPIAQSGTSPDDRAVPRSAPTPTGTPATPAPPPASVSPDDRAVPRAIPTPTGTPVTPAPAPTPTPTASPDDRAFPRSTPVEAPVGGTVSDPGISWAPSPAETAALAAGIALAITGAFFVVGGRRRVRPGPA